MHTDIDIIHCSDACVYIQYPVVICLHIILRLACPTALSLLRLQDKVQSVAEYAPEIADQLFHDEAIFMPRADHMEPLSFVLAVEATAVDVSGKWKRERERIYSKCEKESSICNYLSRI